MCNKENPPSLFQDNTSESISNRKANKACCISQNHRDTPHYSSDPNHHLPMLHLSYKNSLQKQASLVKTDKTGAVARGLRLSPVLLLISWHFARISCATSWAGKAFIKRAALLFSSILLPSSSAFPMRLRLFQWSPTCPHNLNKCTDEVKPKAEEMILLLWAPLCDKELSWQWNSLRWFSHPYTAHPWTDRVRPSSTLSLRF